MIVVSRYGTYLNCVFLC